MHNSFKIFSYSCEGRPGVVAGGIWEAQEDFALD